MTTAALKSKRRQEKKTAIRATGELTLTLVTPEEAQRLLSRGEPTLAELIAAEEAKKASATEPKMDHSPARRR